MLVYRKAARVLSGDRVVHELVNALPSSARLDASEALLRAGELECALMDLAHPSAAVAVEITDLIADRFVSGGPFAHARCAQLLAQLQLPRRLQLRVPEGYAYYALSPGRYAELAQRLERSAAWLVIGIRSIGTSLGAALAAALRAHKVPVSRISVRPSGHPWDRRVTWSEHELARIHALLGAGASFAVVDEGPGMSGSSFLAVADALERCGVGSGHVDLCCSHLPDAQRLLAPRAAQRWQRYRVHPIKADRPESGALDLAAGSWRRLCFGDPDDWPAVWPQLERTKLRSSDARWVDKFEGLPPYGDAARERAQLLAQAGYGPHVTPSTAGFARYAFVAGRAARARDLSDALIEELARYCAFRTRAFAHGGVDQGPLAEMLRVNTLEGLGVDLGARLPLILELPVIADARMQPHKWRSDGRDGWIKLDGHGDGDAHLLPGPCDVCWDLAGAIVEWRMSPDAADRLVSRFERLSGTAVRGRLPAYRAAYCAQRMAEMTFAASSDQRERPRALAARARYARTLAAILRESGIATPPAREEREAWSR